MPGEGQHGSCLLAHHAHCMQGRIQHQWVNSEPTQRHIDIVGDGNIGEELRFPPPHGRQTLKRPAIFIAQFGESLIGAIDINRGSTQRRPHRQIRCRGNRLCPQYAPGMQHPPESDSALREYIDTGR